MDSEIKKQLEEIHALAKDNHQMLRAIRRHQWYSVVWSIVFWLVIIITPFYIYQQYLQPLVSRFQVGSNVSGGAPSTEIGKLLNLFGAGR